jgi:site-specific recombinase XerD
MKQHRRRKGRHCEEGFRPDPRNLHHQRYGAQAQYRCLLCRLRHTRRTFVTQLLVAGADLNTVRHLAGHQALQTTAAYDFRDQGQRVKALRALEMIRAR